MREFMNNLEEEIKTLESLIEEDESGLMKDGTYYYNLGRLEAKQVVFNQLKDIITKEEK